VEDRPCRKGFPLPHGQYRAREQAQAGEVLQQLRTGISNPADADLLAGTGGGELPGREVVDPAFSRGGRITMRVG
jgi:hypothetical protein